eukprot:3306105-Prymnesium_polylepis.1
MCAVPLWVFERGHSTNTHDKHRATSVYLVGQAPRRVHRRPVLLGCRPADARHLLNPEAAECLPLLVHHERLARVPLPPVLVRAVVEAATQAAQHFCPACCGARVDADSVRRVAQALGLQALAALCAKKIDLPTAVRWRLLLLRRRW